MSDDKTPISRKVRQEITDATDGLSPEALIWLKKQGLYEQFHFNARVNFTGVGLGRTNDNDDDDGRRRMPKTSTLLIGAAIIGAIAYVMMGGKVVPFSGDSEKVKAVEAENEKLKEAKHEAEKDVIKAEAEKHKAEAERHKAESEAKSSLIDTIKETTIEMGKDELMENAREIGKGILFPDDRTSNPIGPDDIPDVDIEVKYGTDSLGSVGDRVGDLSRVPGADDLARLGIESAAVAPDAESIDPEIEELFAESETDSDQKGSTSTPPIGIPISKNELAGVLDGVLRARDLGPSPLRPVSQLGDPFRLRPPETPPANQGSGGGGSPTATAAKGSGPIAGSQGSQAAQLVFDQLEQQYFQELQANASADSVISRSTVSDDFRLVPPQVASESIP